MTCLARNLEQEKQPLIASSFSQSEEDSPRQYLDGNTSGVWYLDAREILLLSDLSPRFLPLVFSLFFLELPAIYLVITLSSDLLEPMSALFLLLLAITTLFCLLAGFLSSLEKTRC